MLTSFSEQLHVSPIEPRSRACENPDALWQQVYELFIPVPHLAPGSPERTEDGRELSPALLLQSLHEGGPLTLFGGGAHDIELGCELGVRLRVVLDRVADV